MIQNTGHFFECRAIPHPRPPEGGGSKQHIDRIILWPSSKTNHPRQRISQRTIPARTDNPVEIGLSTASGSNHPHAHGRPNCGLMMFDDAGNEPSPRTRATLRKRTACWFELVRTGSKAESSPRTRLPFIWLTPTAIRIIPARTGYPEPSMMMTKKCANHPCTHGLPIRPNLSNYFSNESSLHARATLARKARQTPP
jgi:hypothetical protein